MSETNDPARAVLAALGIPIKARKGTTWNGRTLRIDGLTPSDLLHETAHWLIATSAERSQPNFGFNESPHLVHSEEQRFFGFMREIEWKEMKVTRKNPEWQRAHRASDQLEQRASALGIALERALGLATWEQTCGFHSWTLEDFERFSRRVDISRCVARVMKLLTQVNTV